MYTIVHVHAWLLSILQVFKAQRKGSLEVFAAKRITIKDSDQFDTQTEVIISHTDACVPVGLCHEYVYHNRW